MDAALARVEVRPFDMDAEHAGDAPVHGRFDGSDGGVHHFRIVADERRQQPRRAEAAMGGSNRPDPIHVRAIVQKHVAAPVHLRVDEARHEPAASEIEHIIRGRHFRGGHDGDDAVAGDEDGMVVELSPGENQRRPDQCGSVHSVRVTLERCGGRSGLRPRLIASAFASR